MGFCVLENQHQDSPPPLPPHDHMHDQMVFCPRSYIGQASIRIPGVFVILFYFFVSKPSVVGRLVPPTFFSGWLHTLQIWTKFVDWLQIWNRLVDWLHTVPLNRV